MRRLRVRKAASSCHRLRTLVGDFGFGQTDRRLDRRQIDLLAALQPVVEPRQGEVRRLGRRGRARDRQPVAAGDERHAELPLDPVEMLVALAVQRRQQQIVVEFELGAPFGRLRPDDAGGGRGHAATVPAAVPATIPAAVPATIPERLC